MIDIILVPFLFLSICDLLIMIWKYYKDNKNQITEKEWTNFHRTLNYLYHHEGMEHYGQFICRRYFKEVEIGEMFIYLKKDDYSFKRHFLKHKSNSYYTVNYMPYDSFTTDIFKLTPEEMMFELYTDFDVLIAEFLRLMRDRKKIYKKKLIESICKEKDIC